MRRNTDYHSATLWSKTVNATPIASVLHYTAYSNRIKSVDTYSVGVLQLYHRAESFKLIRYDFESILTSCS